MTRQMNVAIIGLGKMGLSHFAIANASSRLNVIAICDSSALVGEMLSKYCNVPFVAKYDDVLALPDLHGVIIATPTRAHDEMVRNALARGIHVLCEKPLTLTGAQSEILAIDARARGLVCAVGYHNRFIGTFGEARRLVELDAVGRIRHVHAEAYGPVVLKPAARTWRSKGSEGGGCLYDYAAHPINLMNWMVGKPVACNGAELAKQFSVDVEDAVYANLRFGNDVTGQITVNWSDETHRKMTTRISIFGDRGKIVADRQEIQVHIGAGGTPPKGYGKGWTVKYITELTPPVDYYLRGEEYSAQIEAFATAMQEGRVDCVNDFGSAAITDFTLEMIRDAARAGPVAGMAAPAAPVAERSVLARILGR